MAESTDIPDFDGTRRSIATDDVTIGGTVVRVQRMKLGYGTDSNYTDMDEKPATLAQQIAGMGAAGDAPPALASNASGQIGWLRKIVDTLASLVVGLRDGAGNVFASILHGSGQYGLMIAQGPTNFIPSTANSFSGAPNQLAAGATWIGTAWETIYASQCASIMVFSDQPGTLTIMQAQNADGSARAPDIVISHAANSGLNRNYTGNGNFVRFKYTNNGPSSSTLASLNVAYGVLPAVDEMGNSPVTINGIGGAPLSIGPNVPASSLPVALPTDVIVGAAASIAAINVDLLSGTTSGWLDVRNYHSASIQIIAGAGISAGAIIFEQTNDPVNAPNGNVWAVEEDTGLTPTPQIAAITIAASTTRMFRGPKTAGWVRVRVSTAFAGGTVQAAADFSQLPYSRMVQTVHQPTGSSLNSQVTGAAGQGATASGNPVFTGGIGKTTQPTARTDGQIIAPLLGKVGHTITLANQIRDLRTLQAMVTLTSTTETTIAAAVASQFNDPEWLKITSTATFTGSPTAVRVDFRDVAAGTVRFSEVIPLTPGTPIPAIPWPAPAKQATVNTAWTAQVAFVGGTSPAIGSGDIRITVQTVGNI